MLANSRSSVPATGLSPAELASYAEQGFLVKRRLFDAAFMRHVAAEVEGLHERMAAHAPETVHVSWEEGLAADRPPRIRQLLHSELVAPLIDAVSRSSELLDIMRQLIGPDLFLFHSKLMMKAAHDGTFTPWHQDWGYWQHEAKEPTQVNGMLFIDAGDEENGSIRFVPGSHQQGPIDHRRFQSRSFGIGLEGDLGAFDAKLLLMEPGDAVFFGPLVIHGSGPNRSARDRRANTFAFDKPGNRLADGELPAHRRRAGSSPSARTPSRR